MVGCKASRQPPYANETPFHPHPWPMPIPTPGTHRAAKEPLKKNVGITTRTSNGLTQSIGPKNIGLRKPAMTDHGTAPVECLNTSLEVITFCHVPRNFWCCGLAAVDRKRSVLPYGRRRDVTRRLLGHGRNRGLWFSSHTSLQATQMRLLGRV